MHWLYITAIFVGFLIICRLFSVILLSKGGIYRAPSWIFLIFVTVFLTLKEHHYKSDFLFFPFFFCTFSPRFNLLSRGVWTLF